MTELILALVALGSVLSSILSWVVKLRWSNAYRAAKDQEAKAKDATIESLEREIKSRERDIQSLRELNPPTIHEWSAASIKALEGQVATVTEQLADKDRQIQELSATGIASAEREERLISERAGLGTMLDSFRSLLASVHARDVAHQFVPGSTFRVAVGPLKDQSGKVLERRGAHTVLVEINVMEDLVTEMDERTLVPTRRVPVPIVGICNPQTGEVMRIDFDSSRLIKEE